VSLGGSKTQSTTDVRLNSIAVNQSSYGNAIALVYGQNRVPLTLLWYGNFIATAHTAKQAGGKGGGGGSSNTTYTYTASLIMGLSEGPISGIGQVFQDKVVTTLAALGLTLFSGAGGQAVWSYLTTNFPSQAVPYDHTAYVAVANYSLGSSAALPNFTFELTGFLPYSVGVINDAEPSAILLDYCTDPNHGANFNALNLTTLQGAGATTYQTYCIAMGFFISPYESTQRNASDFITEQLQLTNSNAFMSAGVLNVVPYADTPVFGNGRTFIPNLTPVYSFTDDDYMPGTTASTGADPVVVSRLPLADTYNTVRVEFLDRTNAYNTAIAEATDAQDIALNGVRVMATLSFHQITVASVARQVAQLILQRQLYIRSSFIFCVRPDYCLLEPMDLVAINDSVLGISNKLVRITEVDDDENDNITITAEDMLVGSASAPLYNWQASQGYASNYGVAPPNVATPLIFNGPPLLVSASGGYELWVAVDQGAAGSWGGCDVYMSLDNVSYIYAGTVNGAARYGALTASLPSSPDPDTTDTLGVALTNSATTTLQLVSGSAADYANLRTLIYVDGEIMAFQNAALTGAGTYNLTTLRRAQYGSTAGVHAIGSQFARIDGGIFRVPFDVGMMGQTVYFKFCSFNIFQKAYQSLGAVTAYPHVLANVNAGQNMPGALTLIASVGVTTAGNTAFRSGQISNWDGSLYSAQSYANCSASCYAGQTNPINGIMLGLTTNPLLSNSYTNLNYAWYAAGGGALQVYESGAFTGVGVTYTTSALLNIVYDGKHVAYYANGVLVRSVPVTGLTLFLQIAICDPGNTVYGIDFTPVGAATQPFTLLPLATTVATAGTKAAGNNTGANGWGTKNFQSKESYANGCTLSAGVVAGVDALFIGLSKAPTTGDTTGLLYTLAGWYPHGAASTCQIIFNGVNLGAFGGPPVASDVFGIVYDNFNFYWYRNGALILQRPYVNAGPLYLFGDFFEPFQAFVNISFLPYSAATPQQFIARGECVVSDTNVSKIASGTGAWTTGDAYSIMGYPTCHVVAKANDNAHDIMLALVSGGPPATINYTGLSYAINLQAAGSLVQIYESGVGAGAFGGFTASDYFAITYDGATVTYLKNGIALRTLAVAGLIMFADVDIYLPGGGVNSLEFGPGATIPILDTPQLGANAASQMASNYSATAVTNTTAVSGTTIQTTVISVALTTTGFPVAVDAMCVASWSTSTAAHANTALLSVYRDGVIVPSSNFDGTSYVAGRTAGPAIPVTLSVTDTPPAGAHTYELHYTGQSGGTSGTVTATMINNFIKVREIKK
jgi:hypothetical protein